MMNTDTIIIGIAGASASGKTTIAKKIKKNLISDGINAEIIKMDDYYHSFTEFSLDERKLKNYDHPNAFDIDLLVNNVKKIKNGESILNPIYDFENYTRKNKKTTITEKQVIIIEGIFTLYYSDLKELLNFSLFIDADNDECLMRRINRDLVERNRTMESVTKDYFSNVKPMFIKYVKNTKNSADIIVPNGEIKDCVLTMLITYIKNEINKM